MRTIKRLLLLLLVLAACVGCDQTTKRLAESNLPREQALSFLAGTVRLQVAHNEGAFLSVGDSLPKAWRLAALRGGVAAMLVALLAYALCANAMGTPLMLALSLIFAGGFSNLIDRFVNDGYVIDFLNLGIGSLRTGIFNVADIAITAGALLLFLPNWRRLTTDGKPSN